MRTKWRCANQVCDRKPKCDLTVTEYPDDEEFPFICPLDHGEVDFELAVNVKK